MPNSRSRARVALLSFSLMLVALLAACGTSQTPTLAVPVATAMPAAAFTPTPPEGWTIHSQPDFQVALPASWQELPLDEAALQSLTDQASNDNPHMADLLRDLIASGQAKDLQFFAVDKTSSTVISNISVTRASLPAGTTMDQAIRDYAETLPQLLKGARLVSFDVAVEINGQQAGEIVYDLPLVNPAGQVATVRGMQYLIAAKSGQPYVVTVSGDATDADRFMPLAREIGRTFLAHSK